MYDSDTGVCVCRRDGACDGKSAMMSRKCPDEASLSHELIIPEFLAVKIHWDNAVGERRFHRREAYNGWLARAVHCNAYVCISEMSVTAMQRSSKEPERCETLILSELILTFLSVHKFTVT